MTSRSRLPKPVRPATRDRLLLTVTRWRRQQAEGTSIDTKGVARETPQATIYRQCANDLELALRDNDAE